MPIRSTADWRELIAVNITQAIASARDEAPPELEPLIDQVDALLQAGGKRIRPRFCYWGYVAAGGEEEAIGRVCAAIEILHTFALITDDVMDAGKVRRGQRTAVDALTDDPDDPRAARAGAASAILAGLFGLVVADHLFSAAPFDPAALARAREEWLSMRLDAIGGQYLDTNPTPDVAAERIGQLKSGSYTVTGPLLIGASLATDDDEILDVLWKYSRPLGTAFQLRDDILSVFSDPLTTGKDHDSDLRDGKHTSLIEHVRAHPAKPEHLTYLDQWLGNPELGTEEADGLRAILAASGAVEAVEQRIETLVFEAKSTLFGSTFEEKATQELALLADEAARRLS